MLYTFEIEGEQVVVGSNAGRDSHPLWYLDLKANPHVTVDIDGTRYEAIARDVIGDDRDRLWMLVTAADPSYAQYEERTERQIPVVVLDRQE